MTTSYFGCEGLLTERDSRNMWAYTLWMLATVFVWGATSMLIARMHIAAPLGWALTAVTLVLALVTVRSYLTFLHEADELLRKIQIEGLALGFCAGVMFMLIWRLCERLGAPRLDMDDPFIVMMLFWALGQYLGTRRYAAGEER